LQNIAKAQKEIEKLEAEEDEGAANGTTDAARKPAQKAVNGNASAEADQKKDAADDAADDLKKASLEDNKTEA
jgi:hypothetical protein